MRKKVLDFDNYSVDEYGEIYGNNKPTPLYTWVDNVGYKQVVLYYNGKRYYKRVHRVVYEAFHGKIKSEDEKLVVNHIDGNKLNNSIGNLELITNSQNTIEHLRNNEIKKYDISVHNKVTGDFVARYKSIRKLCLELDLNRKTVSNIINCEDFTNNTPYYFFLNTI